MHVKYYSNGQLEYTGKYVSGMKDGDWLFYDEMGFNYLKITYQSDVEVAWQEKKYDQRMKKVYERIM